MEIRRAVVVPCLLALASAAPAAAQLCAVEQISVPASAGLWSNNPSIDGVGDLVAFVSRGDFTGGNPDGSFDIYLHSIDADYLQFLVGTVPPHSCAAPKISADGAFLAFACSGNITGGNPDLSQEIYRHDLVNNVTIQVTATVGDQNEVVAISGDGNRIAFESTGDYAGSNADGSFELFVHQASDNSFRQITSCAGFVPSSIPASFDLSGNLLAYDFDCDLPDNADGADEVLLYRWSTNTSTRLTNGVGDSGFPRLSGDGLWLTFSSEADLVGDNPAHLSQIFLLDLTSLALTQVTQEGANGSDLSDDGNRLAFSTPVPLTLGDANGVGDIHLLDRSTGELVRVTNQIAEPAFNWDLSGDGSTLAFVSFDDLTGENPDGDLQVYVTDVTACGAGVPQPAQAIPTVSELGLAALALGLAAVVLADLARRRRLA